MDLKKETMKLIEQLFEYNYATCTQFKDEGGIYGILITDGQVDHHKKAFNELILSYFGVYGEDLQKIVDMSKDDLELAKKIVKLKLLKSQVSELEGEIKVYL